MLKNLKISMDYLLRLTCTEKHHNMQYSLIKNNTAYGKRDYILLFFENDFILLFSYYFFIFFGNDFILSFSYYFFNYDKFFIFHSVTIEFIMIKSCHFGRSKAVLTRFLISPICYKGLQFKNLVTFTIITRK